MAHHTRWIGITAVLLALLAAASPVVAATVAAERFLVAYEPGAEQQVRWAPCLCQGALVAELS